MNTTMEKTSLVIVNKDERSLSETLRALKPYVGSLLHELLVVDASRGALDDIRISNDWVRWIDYEPPNGVRTTIAHQRNVGVRNSAGDVIVFTDSGCLPEENWLDRLLAPIHQEGEFVTCGPVRAIGASVYSPMHTWGDENDTYVTKATTINMAFRKRAFEVVGGFDESFGAGEDIDFAWRLTDAGYRLRWVPNAVIRHDWGNARRQIRRAFFYGKGACRLLKKHPNRLGTDLKENPVPVVYSLFLLGLPLTLKWRWYPLMLLWPIWRNRNEEIQWLVVIDHLVMGAGALYELVRPNT